MLKIQEILAELRIEVNNVDNIEQVNKLSEIIERLEGFFRAKEYNNTGEETPEYVNILAKLADDHRLAIVFTEIEGDKGGSIFGGGMASTALTAIFKLQEVLAGLKEQILDQMPPELLMQVVADLIKQVDKEEK